MTVGPGEPAQAAPSKGSRTSQAGAGWECDAGSAYGEQARHRARRFSWLNPAPLWISRNDRLARLLGDPTNARRKAWMDDLHPAGDPGLTVDVPRPGGSASCLVLGDTGEGDESQFAVVPPLLSQAKGVDFMFICSDVIYPAGGAEEYEDKFFRPYAGYAGPIYAVPGNHDWYDDCTGFMRWFCGVEEIPRWHGPGVSPKAWLRRLLWRRPPRSDPERLARIAAMREMPGQPGPYFAIEAGPLLLVGIDTGIRGDIDDRQAAWLRRVSRESTKPKILLTGKPIYVDGEYRKGEIEGSGDSVDSIVTDPDHNYIAAIGGDIHNYQRYPVRLDDGRKMLYLVSGGGGAFMHATHTIPSIDQADISRRVSEAEFRCYPLRGDSLSLYSKLYARKLGPLASLTGEWIPPEEASAYLGDQLEIPPTRDDATRARVSGRSRRLARVLMRLPGKGRGSLHLPFSEWLDWNDAPLFKSFLRIDADEREVRIRCFAATGCAHQEKAPPVEDDLRWSFASRAWQLPSG